MSGFVEEAKRTIADCRQKIAKFNRIEQEALQKKAQQPLQKLEKDKNLKAEAAH